MHPFCTDAEAATAIIKKPNRDEEDKRTKRKYTRSVRKKKRKKGRESQVDKVKWGVALLKKEIKQPQPAAAPYFYIYHHDHRMQAIRKLADKIS